jgi:pyridoxal phosphate enzyme (YggS family)
MKNSICKNKSKMGIAENIEKIRQSLPNNIEILAAAKSRNISGINEAISAGIKIIGENYVNDAEKKCKELKGRAEIHCIGHLQSNKIKKAVEIFDCIQTIDSERLAEEISKQCEKIGKIMPVLIEVNIAREQSKNGCLPEKVSGLAKYILTLKNIKLKGLMAMGPFFKNEEIEKIRPYFRETKKLFDDMKKLSSEIDTLSIGMSDSYKIAAEEGATMVRIGARIFGNRD